MLIEPRSSIEALTKSIPDDYREGSYALGATKWQTIKHIVTSLLAPAASMPNLIYNYCQLQTKYPALAVKVYAAAFLLILLVLLLNSIAKIISYQASRMMKH